jgi:hypothetical protein
MLQLRPLDLSGATGGGASSDHAAPSVNAGEASRDIAPAKHDPAASLFQPPGDCAAPQRQRARKPVDAFGRKTKPRIPERAVQRTAIAMLNMAGVIAVHVANGAELAGTPTQRAKQMQALKRDGFRPGFPDLILFGRSGRIGFLECKRPDGGAGLSANQVWWRDELRARGFSWALCQTPNDALDALTRWGWPEGGRVRAQ